MIRIAVKDKDCVPFKGHRWDAGWDLMSQNDTFTLKPGDKVKVSTGVSLEIPPRNMGLIVPRSGLGAKFRVGLANTVGIIDSEYRGEVFVITVNDGKESVEIKKGDRFCQLIIVPVNMDVLRVVDKLSETGRGAGGYGSTGIEAPALKVNIESDQVFLDELELDEIIEWTESA